jgi:hypothetical protein
MHENPKTNKYSLKPWLILVSVLIALLASAMLVFKNARDARSNKRNSCASNLRQIDGAKEQWAVEKKISSGTPIDQQKLQEINVYIRNQTTPLCPGGGTYLYNAIDQEPKCSIHGGLW